MSYVKATMRPVIFISAVKKMRLRKVASLVSPLLVAACSSAPKQSTVSIKSPDKSGSYLERQENSESLVNILIKAEGSADETGRKILMTGRMMTIDKQEIVKGSCWDFPILFTAARAIRITK